MEKRKLELLLFYLIYIKAISEVLKYSRNLTLEQLKLLNEIIIYNETHERGVYIEDLIKTMHMSKRNIRYYLEHLYHLNWIIKVRDDADQRRLLILPTDLYHKKLDILFIEVEEVIKLKYFSPNLKHHHSLKLSYVIIIYSALNQVEQIAQQFNLTLDELFVLGKLIYYHDTISLKSVCDFSHHCLIGIPNTINHLSQKGYITKCRNNKDERLVNIKIVESRTYETETLFIQCYNKLQMEMKINDLI
ncbi:hypothetical protein E2558_07145 [Staphylococcus pragensis]|uniref:Transcriptional regulator SarA/SarZ/Rot-like helix-turn-helix domain-containing protein n=1 Tax=Staphylococcus pragensis TaxID=1611836 RepID=A0A4Z1B894_9STAP|nr:hypothetical protein [Staphylococcus pragensis]RTX89313.1 hypothetical protein CD154_07575 [Staphylococcus carnosus]TGN27616.1 hypothetical protein E2558_07145 [Staphylococcus pragensis]GGG91351.1 hypothetical protein GCM10007342_12600 [Staphylococcus pragensis]